MQANGVLATAAGACWFFLCSQMHMCGSASDFAVKLRQRSLQPPNTSQGRGTLAICSAATATQHNRNELTCAWREGKAQGKALSVWLEGGAGRVIAHLGAQWILLPHTTHAAHV
jgi:hypothetical protein